MISKVPSSCPSPIPTPGTQRSVKDILEFGVKVNIFTELLSILKRNIIAKIIDIHIIVYRNYI